MQNAELEALRKLDALDTKAFRVRQEIADLPGDLARWQKALADAQARVVSGHQEQNRAHQEIQKLALETKTNQDTITKYQVQQNTVKTNEEYTQLKKQIEALRKQNGDLDDKQLALYDKVDKLKEAEKGLKAGVKLAEEKLGVEAAESKEEETRLKAELDELLAERARTEKLVSAGTLAQYKRVLDKLGKKALAQVQGRTCQGCFIELSPQYINLLLSGKEVVSCPQCARVLFLERDYKAVTSLSYTVSDKDRSNSTSKDGNW